MSFEFAYLIFSHANVLQLQRLVHAIRKSSPNSAIVLHHDPSGEPLNPSEFTAMKNVFFIAHPVAVRWADITQVHALLHGLEWATSRLDFRWISIISGQDYPLRSLMLAEQELRETEFDAFVEANPIKASDWSMFTRYYFQYWKLPRFRHHYKAPAFLRNYLQTLRQLINRSRSPVRIEGGIRNTPMQLGVRTLAHPFSASFACYKGSDWFTLSRKAVNYVQEFTRKNPDYLRYFQRTYIASEAYIQTILWNSPQLKIANNNRRFILWDANHSSHPITLAHKHLGKMTASGKDFGRKFDPKLDNRVLDELDQIITNPASD